MLNSWLVTLPPLLVLILAMLTHNVLFSLLSGIIAACALLSGFAPLETIYLSFTSIINETQFLNFFTQTGNFDHLYTFGFLTILGIIIQLMAHTGGIKAYTQAITKFLKDKRSAESTSLILSCTFFLDDYLNNLTTGSIMQPITDTFAIPRAKLAYLIDSMSGALCLLIPASSWIAFSLMQLQTSGVSAELIDKPVILTDPLIMYLQTLPYLLYPLAITFSAWLVVRKRIAFGTMFQHEREAETTGNLFGGKNPKMSSQQRTATLSTGQGSLSYFIIPIGTFLLSIPGIALWAAGWSPFNGTITWFKAMQNADIILKSLFFSTVISFTISSLYLLARKAITIPVLARISWLGFGLMRNSLVVLLFAWTLSSLLKNDLKTGVYIANFVMESVPFCILPFALFITSTLITASTGSSWGTLTIMLPIAIPMFAALTHTAIPINPADVPLLLPMLGAIFSGTVSGGHFSPITDTTVMSSSSAGCYHIDHVQTQMTYSMPALISSLVGFLLFAVLPASWISLVVVLVAVLGLTAGILMYRNQRKS